jgi:hypothetical protein
LEEWLAELKKEYPADTKVLELSLEHLDSVVKGENERLSDWAKRFSKEYGKVGKKFKSEPNAVEKFKKRICKYDPYLWPVLLQQAGYGDNLDKIVNLTIKIEKELYQGQELADGPIESVLPPASEKKIGKQEEKKRSGLDTLANKLDNMTDAFKSLSLQLKQRSGGGSKLQCFGCMGYGTGRTNAPCPRMNKKSQRRLSTEVN